MKSKTAIKISIGITALTLALVSVLFIVTLNNKQPKAIPTIEGVSSVPISSQEKPEPKPPTTARLIGVGDNLIHEGIYNQAKKRAGGVGYDFAFAYEEMEHIIGLADIASINQETMMADIYEPSSYPMFNSPTQLGEQMMKIGFDVFNQANNHSFDKGERGVLSNLNFWAGKPQAKVTGIYRNQEDYENIRTLEKNGIVFSFIGMTELTNGLNLPKGSEVVLMRTGDEEKIKARIEKAKSISDVVVVNVHWGAEYTHTPSGTQKALAEKMVNWGADIILGHHPHVIQPVEYITRPDGTRGVVCYSLGNFISAQNRGARMVGGMLDVTVEKDNEANKVSLKTVRFIPVVTHYGYGFANIKTYPLKSYPKELANTHGVKTNTSEFSYEYIQNIVNQVIDEQFLTDFE